MADDAPHLNLSARQAAFVAAYIGVARNNAAEAARMAGYSEKNARTIGSENLTKAHIAAAIDAWRAEVKQRGVASLEYRLNRLDEMECKLWDVVRERAIAYADDPGAAGGGTGFIVRQEKMIGGGMNAQTVTEYVVDTGLTKEIRAVYDDAAKEIGQRRDGIDVSGSLRREIVLVDDATAVPKALS